jgi:hypothetical protein
MLPERKVKKEGNQLGVCSPSFQSQFGSQDHPTAKKTLIDKIPENKSLPLQKTGLKICAYLNYYNNYD